MTAVNNRGNPEPRRNSRPLPIAKRIRPTPSRARRLERAPEDIQVAPTVRNPTRYQPRSLEAAALSNCLSAIIAARGMGRLRVIPSLAPRPEIDLSSSSPKLAAMRSEAQRFGIDFDCLMTALCKLSHVEKLENLGNMGPPNASIGGDYDCLFGRDPQEQAKNLGATLALAARRRPEFPDVIRATVMRHGSLQAQRYDFARDAQPGEIIHEHRNDERGRMLEAKGWAFPYYGATDSTPVHTYLIWLYCQLYPEANYLDEQMFYDASVDPMCAGVTIRESALAATLWTLNRLDDPRGGGFLWTEREKSHNGIPNQVWKDSIDSYPFDGPYAAIECQGYAYDQLLCMAELLERYPGDAELEPESRLLAAALRARASKLRDDVFEHFALYDERGQFLTFDHAVKLEDGKVTHAHWITSNPGRLLQTRLLDDDPARPQIARLRRALVERLFAEDMIGEAGILTLSRNHPKYGPGDYHNGSIWPTDVMSVIDGLIRHGMQERAGELIRRMLGSIGRAQALKAGFDFPEFFRSDGRLITREGEEIWTETRGVRHLKEQPPQKLQGWTASAVWACLSYLADQQLGVAKTGSGSPEPMRFVAAAAPGGGIRYVDQLAGQE